MTGRDRIIRLFYAAEDSDRIVGCRLREVELRLRKPQKIEPMPIKAVEFACKPKQEELAGLTAYLAGISLVFTPTGAVAIGTPPSLSFWRWPYPMTALPEARLCVTEVNPPLGKYIREANTKRIDLPRQWRYVRSRYKPLRAPNGGLRLQGDGFRLGGILAAELRRQTSTDTP